MCVCTCKSMCVCTRVCTLSPWCESGVQLSQRTTCSTSRNLIPHGLLQELKLLELGQPAYLHMPRAQGTNCILPPHSKLHRTRSRHCIWAQQKLSITVLLTHVHICCALLVLPSTEPEKKELLGLRTPISQCQKSAGALTHTPASDWRP